MVGRQRADVCTRRRVGAFGGRAKARGRDDGAAEWHACSNARWPPVAKARMRTSFCGLLLPGLLGHLVCALRTRRDVRHLVLLASLTVAPGDFSIHALARLSTAHGRSVLSANPLGVRPESRAVP